MTRSVLNSATTAEMNELCLQFFGIKTEELNFRFLVPVTLCMFVLALCRTRIARLDRKYTKTDVADNWPQFEFKS